MQATVREILWLARSHLRDGWPAFADDSGAPRSGEAASRPASASRAHADQVSVGVPAFAFLLGWADRGRAHRRPRHPESHRR